VAGLNTIESKSVTNVQVAEVVTAVLKSGVSSEQATELASSAKVLESILGEQAAEVFAAVSVEELTAQDGQAIVNAVQDAPLEIKEAFEEEINVFDGVFDNYIAVDSIVDIKTRRILVAATGVIIAMAGVGASGAGTAPENNSQPSGGGGSPSSDNRKSSKIRRRRLG